MTAKTNRKTHKNKQTKNKKTQQKKRQAGTSLVAQWLSLCTPNAGGLDSTPGQGTRSHTCAAAKSSHATTKEPACHY